MRFGNTPRMMIGPIIIVFVFLGCLAAGLKIFLVHRTGSEVTLFDILIFPIGAPLFMLLVLSPTWMVSITVEMGRVRHLLFGRFVLSDYPIVDFKRVAGPEGFFGAVLYFSGNRKIRFIGAYMGELAALEKYLKEEKDRG